MKIPHRQLLFFKIKAIKSVFAKHVLYGLECNVIRLDPFSQTRFSFQYEAARMPTGRRWRYTGDLTDTTIAPDQASHQNNI